MMTGRSNTYRTMVEGFYQQRAQLSGFIEKRLGESIFNELCQYPFLAVRCGARSHKNFCKGSMAFDLNFNCISSKTKQDKPYIHSSGIRLWNHDQPIRDYIDYKSDRSKEIVVYFGVMDIEFNNNRLWKILLNLLIKYT